MRGRRIAADYERHNASAARRPQRRPHAADLASDHRDHSDASAMRRSRVGRTAADYAPTFITVYRPYTVFRGIKILGDRGEEAV